MSKSKWRSSCYLRIWYSRQQRSNITCSNSEEWDAKHKTLLRLTSVGAKVREMYRMSKVSRAHYQHLINDIIPTRCIHKAELFFLSKLTVSADQRLTWSGLLWDSSAVTLYVWNMGGQEKQASRLNVWQACFIFFRHHHIYDVWLFAQPNLTGWNQIGSLQVREVQCRSHVI